MTFYYPVILAGCHPFNIEGEVIASLLLPLQC